MQHPYDASTASLEDKTRVYWQLSSYLHNKPSQIKQITTERALHQVGDTVAFLNPGRPLSAHLNSMRSSLISGGRRAKTSRTPATVLKFRAVATK